MHVTEVTPQRSTSLAVADQAHAHYKLEKFSCIVGIHLHFEGSSLCPVVKGLQGCDRLFSKPSDGVFGRFDLAALLRLPHQFLFVCLLLMPLLILLGSCSIQASTSQEQLSMVKHPMRGRSWADYQMDECSIVEMGRPPQDSQSLPPHPFACGMGSDIGVQVEECPVASKPESDCVGTSVCIKRN